MQRVEFQCQGLTIVGHLHTPENFDSNKKYAAIVMSHPAGGVKEQTTDTYAAEMAKAGYVALSYDRSYNGESIGEPHNQEIPYLAVANILSGIDYLASLPFVDTDRIGALGICAGGGYVVAAAIQDKRIKAVATVSAVNLGEGLRSGWDGQSNPNKVGLDNLLKAAGDARNARMQGAEPVYVPFVPQDITGVTLPDMLEAHEYYFTPRANHPRAVSRMLIENFIEQSSFDAFHLIETRLTQPILAVTGANANTRWFSEQIQHRAVSSQDNTLHIVPEATHISMYDYHVAQAVEVIVPFFDRTI